MAPPWASPNTSVPMIRPIGSPGVASPLRVPSLHTQGARRTRQKENDVRHEGSLGPVPQRRMPMPVVPSRWRLPALIATVGAKDPR